MFHLPESGVAIERRLFRRFPIHPSHKIMNRRFTALIALILPCHAAITPVNPGFDDAPFANGWTTTGTVTPGAGLVSPTAALLAASSSIRQDFAPAFADGLVTFTTSFSWRLGGTGGLANDTTRVRLRGNNNAGDLITLRLSSAGLQTFGTAWVTDVAFAPQLGTIYQISVTVGNLDADPALEYQVSIGSGGSINTGPVRNTWHSGGAVVNTTEGTFRFETLTFESGAGNTLSVDHVSLPGFESGALLVGNPDFETLPFPTSWTSTGAPVSVAGLGGSLTAARLPYNTTSSLAQALSAMAQDFTAEVVFQLPGNNEEQAFRWVLESDGQPAVELRTATGGVLQVKDGAEWKPIYQISDGAIFEVPNNQPVRVRVIGRGFGTLDAEYDVVWSDPGVNLLTHAAVGLKAFPSVAATTAPLSAVRFPHDVLLGNSYVVDDAVVRAGSATPTSADYTLVPPSPPSPPKVVNISGVYPHLAMTNTHDECGVGAVVPWAGKLWAITYGPHLPNGSTDKLYEIDTDLNRIVRAESIGGTPANRFIHSASNQLNIGPHFIDASGNVRTLPYSLAPGRHTGTAAHLTDPNRLYLFTMEDGVYDVNATDLTFITRYPDRQGTGDRFLFGYHGKGAYTGQGRLVVANNGRPSNQGTPTGPAGVLATWDGVTVADNGGAYLATNDPNNTAEENATNPVAAQASYIAGWNQVSKTQHCEVTGPGGIHGNPNPATDPIWSTGFDAKSVLLHVMENQQWNLWRLPKGSYSHDGSHGWHTEWPRIRQLDPADPQSPYLMHMHGIFFDFPKTFSAAQFGGLKPISNYYKMPTDYATFGGRIVMGKNDASKFSNPLAQKNQSNFWFGDMDDIKAWGSPAGHGAVWMNEVVAQSEASDPFLIEGFTHRTLHVRNAGGAAVSIAIQTSNGTPFWTTAQTLTVAANAYQFALLDAITAPWVRLVANDASSNLTAFFHLHSPYPHVTPASAASSEFAALADIRDDRSISDGLIRVRDHADLSLEFASSRVSSGGTASAHRYHRIGAAIELEDVANATAESAMRTGAATTKTFGGDDASVWILSGGTRFRLPRLDAAYDAVFGAGWARGVREAVTERELLNCHGTFYEVPRSNSGGYRKMRALATHGKRITDFASWRGLFVLTGVLDDAPESDKLVRNADGTAALWLGEIDDLWRMGEPRGEGGPWKDTAVVADSASDPYLMYGYDRKELRMQAADETTITVEVDFLADNSWSVYQTFTLAAGEPLTHVFPEGFHAHWVRFRSSVDTTASAQLTYGPAEVRDRFLDWAREEGLATGSGREGIASDALLAFVTGSDTPVPALQPMQVAGEVFEIVLRDLVDADRISADFEFSTDLNDWNAPGATVAPSPDQAGVAEEFTRMRVTPPDGAESFFVRLKVSAF